GLAVANASASGSRTRTGLRRAMPPTPASPGPTASALAPADRAVELGTRRRVLGERALAVEELGEELALRVDEREEVDLVRDPRRLRRLDRGLGLGHGLGREDAEAIGGRGDARPLLGDLAEGAIARRADLGARAASVGLGLADARLDAAREDRERDAGDGFGEESARVEVLHEADAEREVGDPLLPRARVDRVGGVDALARGREVGALREAAVVEPGELVRRRRLGERREEPERGVRAPIEERVERP